MTQTGATLQRGGGWWRKWKKVVKTKVEGGPRGYPDVVVATTNEIRRPSSVASAGRVVAVIEAAGASLGGKGSSQMQFDGFYRSERAICGSRARFEA